MRRKIIWILLGALLLLVLALLVWWWYAGREVAPPPSGGSLGTSGERPGQQQTVTPPPTNIGTPVPPSTGVIIGGTTQGQTGSGGSGGGSVGVSSPPGVSWLGGGSIFNPTPINQIDSGASGALPTFGTVTGGGPSGGSGDGSGLEGALIGAGVGVAACTAGFTAGALTGGGASIAARATGAVPVTDAVTNAGAADTALRENFLNCMTRVVARAALDQMTASIVNWINSGFEGKPSFVQNYEQFFTNVADQAAGEFIRGSALSFLCSPFQPQVRIAIARSYARRNNAPSCTLTQVTNNVNRFLQGDFSSGGWGGLLAFTTVPANSPFGAYISAQTGLENSQNTALRTAGQKLAAGQGFISMEEKYDCIVDPDLGPTQLGCKTRITTPGKTIAGIVENTFKIPQDALNLADNFDEIISALLNQLVTRTLQGGLSNLSANQGYASNFGVAENLEAQQEAQALLTGLQGHVSVAQQFGYAKQGSIGDIQNAQEQLQNLANCYIGRGDDDEEDDVLQEIAQLETRVGVYNSDITRANAAIATLQQLQTRVFSATTATEVQTIANDFATAQASGQLITQSAVTQAQQDRTALQSEMSALNQQTTARINQCYAGS